MNGSSVLTGLGETRPSRREEWKQRFAITFWEKSTSYFFPSRVYDSSVSPACRRSSRFYKTVNSRRPTMVIHLHQAPDARQFQMIPHWWWPTSYLKLYFTCIGTPWIWFTEIPKYTGYIDVEYVQVSHLMKWPLIPQTSRGYWDEP